MSVLFYVSEPMVGVVVFCGAHVMVRHKCLLVFGCWRPGSR